MDVSSLRASPEVRLLALALVAGACPVTDVVAATFTVGTGTGCSHSTFADAITAAENSAGADTIRLTRSIAYNQVSAVIATSQELTITGGFDTCTQATSDGILTVLDGAGGAATSVLRITGNTGAIIKLESLTIRNGDVGGTGYGGGVYFRGDGILEIQRSAITNNVAGYGGGIYAEGLGSNAELVIGTNVSIVGNTARYSGGGVYVEALEMTMVDPGSTIFNNEATGTGSDGGYGGGLMVLSGSHAAVATIGTTGPNNFGAIHSNRARYGGGGAVVAAETDDVEASIVIAGTDPNHWVGIRGNAATVVGGGFYAQSADGTFGSITTADLKLRNFSLSENAAPDGAAIYLQQDGIWGGRVFFTQSMGGGQCPVGRACGEISRNQAWNGTQLTDGAIVHLRPETLVSFGEFYGSAAVPSRSGIEMRENRGGRLFYASGNNTVIRLDNIVMTDNQLSQELIRHAGEDASAFRLRNVTIAGNTIGASHVLSKFDQTEIDASIIWQPGKTTLQNNGGTLAVTQVIASEVGSLNAGPEAYVANPRFTDPARGDYSIRAASPAVDGAGASPLVLGDVLGLPRNIDLDSAAFSRGPRDIGAYERQSLEPLVLNADFDADLNLWTEIFTGVSSWTNQQNATGATGSGSVHVTQTNVAINQEIRGRQQCVHLPGPGTYALNGSGRGTGNITVPGDVAQLNWEYRRNGGEACTDGTPTTTGTLMLSNRASWSRAAAPARVTVTPADWTFGSSITIRLVGVENGVSGSPRTTNAWFDGITLVREPTDVIFRNGFDP
ncbi:hypothetical protein ACQQ2N_18975 [Dokdonella sp. MW10]|uniref:hypothetical protein n=1 Tax=Dokdonella sp. MW10 TaxID=2992926 RepID=UPI003F7EE364